MGWVLDFADLKAAVQPLLERLDHHTLNDVDGLDNPTSENLARWFADMLVARLPGLRRIVVSETPTSSCELTV